MARSRTVTMADIAERTGVSVPTVSYILNGRARERNLSIETETRVMETAQRLGYVRNALASNLRSNRTMTLGLVVSDLERGWASRLLRGMQPLMEEAGYNCVLAVHSWDPEREQRQLTAFLSEKKAAIITRPLPENTDTYQQILDHGIPLILLDELDGFDAADSVMWDARKAVHRSVEHLAETGRTRIGYFGVKRGTEEERQRYQSWRYAMKRASLPVVSSRIFLDERFVLREGNEPGRVQGYGEALREAFRATSDRPDAIVCSSDALAMTCISMLRDDLGLRVPRDVAIIGMGDTGESALVGLTTSREPVEQIGAEVMRLTLNRLRNGTFAPVHVRLPGDELAIRTTA